MSVMNHLFTLGFILGLSIMNGSVALAEETLSVSVGSSEELYAAIDKANSTPLKVSIFLQDGLYNINRRLNLIGDGISISSTSGDRDAVILSGQGMKKRANVEVLFDIYGSDISISGVTMSSVGNHLVQVRGEKNADNFSLINSVLRDSYEQMLKVSASQKLNSPYSDSGVVSNCLFEYSQGVGPQFYIAGIDAHRARGWVVKDNTFKHIASPSERVAEHAIHFWRSSSDITITGNTIIDSDRGIGFGLGAKQYGDNGMLIEGNIILHQNTEHPYADAGIVIESASDVKIFNNFIYIKGRYPNAIEYRFDGTLNVMIEGNTVNKRFASRDGGRAKILNNIIVRAIR